MSLDAQGLGMLQAESFSFWKNEKIPFFWKYSENLTLKIETQSLLSLISLETAPLGLRYRRIKKPNICTKYLSKKSTAINSSRRNISKSITSRRTCAPPPTSSASRWATPSSTWGAERWRSAPARMCACGYYRYCWWRPPCSAVTSFRRSSTTTIASNRRCSCRARGPRGLPAYCGWCGRAWTVTVASSTICYRRIFFGCWDVYPTGFFCCTCYCSFWKVERLNFRYIFRISIRYWG